METGQKEQVDPNIVDWDGANDPENPMNWTKARKWTIIGLVATITFNVCMASTIFAPGVANAQQHFHDTDEIEGSLLVSIYLLGLAIGPLFLSPLGELYGRCIPLNVANVAFLIFTIIGAVSQDMPMLFVFRLLMGFACAIPLTLGAGFVADMMTPEERGLALTLWTIGPLLGPVIGPVCGGYLAMNVGWRWTFWLVVILSGIMTVGSLLFVRETYAPRLLELKARRLRKKSGNENLKSKFDKGQTARQLFRMAIVRPTKMLIFSPIVFILSLYVSIVYAYMYLLFTTFNTVFQESYGFNTGESGLVYLGCGVGFIIGQFSVLVFTDKYMARQKAKNIPTKPEDRLPPVIVGAFLLPIGLFWYGWSVKAHTHWIVPILGTGFVGIGIIYVFMPVQLYLVDAYTLYAASAIAASVVVRSIFGTTMPLAGPSMYRAMGMGWGNSMLGFIAMVFAPVSILLFKYGERIRTNPKFMPKL